jgi:hypothetical protein
MKDQGVKECGNKELGKYSKVISLRGWQKQFIQKIEDRDQK